MSEWITAKEAKEITEKAPLRKLNTAKKQIMREIYTCAQKGHYYAVIYIEYYEVSCLEDWCNIYNWLLDLGYSVEDNSRNRISPNFCLRWR